ncbi:adenylosuccinate lyase [Streptococcus pneumoniae]|nr:adenylosuccinate lyase [Streptococcus pneumoniae]
MVGVFREQALYLATATSHYPSKSTAGLQELVRGDRKMFSQLHMREEQVLLAQDYALETARAEGLEQGLERGIERGRAEGREQGREEGLEEGLKVGLVNLVRQGLLTPEVASEQLGMTVAEFESLL